MTFLTYVILFAGVSASWVGIPIVGGAALATAGVLAGDGKLDVWLVILVAAAAAWAGGYVGYLLGARAGLVLTNHPGRWQPQRRRALILGQRFYRRLGPLAVFLTPTWVSGALRMPRSSFLFWNALAAIVSTLVAVFGAYALAIAIFDRLSTGRGVLVAAAVVSAVAVAAAALYRRRGRSAVALPRSAGTEPPRLHPKPFAIHLSFQTEASNVLPESATRLRLDLELPPMRGPFRVTRGHGGRGFHHRTARARALPALATRAGVRVSSRHGCGSRRRSGS